MRNKLLQSFIDKAAKISTVLCGDEFGRVSDQIWDEAKKQGLSDEDAYDFVCETWAGIGEAELARRAASRKIN